MSKTLNILEGESVEEFDALGARLRAEFQPATDSECFLVDQVIHHEWLMRRALRMQQHLGTVRDQVGGAEEQRLRLVVRYYRTHERAAMQARRQLEALRKQQLKKPKVESEGGKRALAETRRMQRQWEQVLKKMPTLTNWVN